MSRYEELNHAGQVAHDLARAGGNKMHSEGRWRDCNSRDCIDYVFEIHATLEAEASQTPEPTEGGTK